MRVVNGKVWNSNFDVDKSLWSKNPANIKSFKASIRNTRKRCEISSKLTIKTPERRSSAFIIDFEQVNVSWKAVLLKLNSYNPFHEIIPFLYPLKTPENQILFIARTASLEYSSCEWCCLFCAPFEETTKLEVQYYNILVLINYCFFCWIIICLINKS